MASLRQKDSMIPLRVDSRLKKMSKIPLRVETKPKIVTSTEDELKRTSDVVKKKVTTDPTDRSKKFSKEISQKKPKPANLQAKNKANENRLQSSSRISQNKVYNNRAPTITATNKGATSKPVSQVLKDRNKITTKNAPERHKPVEYKRKDDPFCTFKKKIPETNILGDSPDTQHTEKKQMNSNHPSQHDIEFVPDDRMRNLILSNRELTPSILKSYSNIKTLFVMERPSLYNRPKISVDPYKQALADIANSNLASEGRRVSEMQKNRLYASPLQNRNSLYQRLTFVGDPYKEALRSLAELRMHRKVKSCKKVTFKLSGEDRSLKTECRYGNDGKNLVEEIQPSLITKCVGSSTCPASELEDNILLASDRTPSKIITDDSSSKPNKVLKQCTKSSTRPTPEFEGNILLASGIIDSKTVTIDSPTKQNEVCVSRQINEVCLPKKTEEHKDNFFISNTNPSTSLALKTVTNNEKAVSDFSPILHQRKKSNENAAIFSCEIKNSIFKPVNPFLNPLGTSEARHSLFSMQSECFLDKINRKIFTPQPVSFYPRTQLPESISPEFLSQRTTDILSWAPINTPSVLKCLSKQEQSPVCKKLEFEYSPKEIYKEPVHLREKNQTFDLQNIMTQQKILDQLAHQECSIFMHEATFPCEVRKHLQNPIAQILNEGDDMHFVPVS